MFIANAIEHVVLVRPPAPWRAGLTDRLLLGARDGRGGLSAGREIMVVDIREIS